MKLSEDRANAVVAWLTAHGVGSDRLTAKGYGDSKPLVPNVTELNRQRNRRVQFMRHARHQLPKRSHFLRLNQLGLR